MTNENITQDEEYNNDEVDTDVDTQVDTQENEEVDNTNDRTTQLEAEVAKYKRMAEQKEKKLQKVQSTTKEDKVSSQVLSTKDQFALFKANVDIDDIDDILDYAKYKGISISEALNSSVVKATLADKSDYRKTSEASNTGGARRGTSKVSDQTLLDNARKGVMPDSDSDMQRLVALKKK